MLFYKSSITLLTYSKIYCFQNKGLFVLSTNINNLSNFPMYLNLDFNILNNIFRSLLKKWTHIMVSWSTEKTSFYINGTSVGWSFHFPSRKEQVEPQNAKLFIGRDTMNSKKGLK